MIKLSNQVSLYSNGYLYVGCMPYCFNNQVDALTNLRATLVEFTEPLRKIRSRRMMGMELHEGDVTICIDTFKCTYASRLYIHNILITESGWLQKKSSATRHCYRIIDEILIDIDDLLGRMKRYAWLGHETVLLNDPCNSNYVKVLI